VFQISKELTSGTIFFMNFSIGSAAGTTLCVILFQICIGCLQIIHCFLRKKNGLFRGAVAPRKYQFAFSLPGLRGGETLPYFEIIYFMPPSMILQARHERLLRSKKRKLLFLLLYVKYPYEFFAPCAAQ
jgi:hypothetical protein